ncbi:hypothetical protein EW146_g7570 [Bondarzewia mesenterica]|uniref:Uncharacterized protein n=1 Tax=Bondarzewia mesenterica TaxID=1095465 RepID=A0A4S4LKF2_9AGAM|nr:hypothetical protein EW146_g7570 [Bondarzewia mesenterica]
MFSSFTTRIMPGQSDYDVTKGSFTKKVLEHHWDSWITEDDWKWISERGLNTVRIPSDSSDMRSLSACWHRLCRTLQRLLGHMDLHAALGKQNVDAHSGTSSFDIVFYTASNMSQTTQILLSLLTHLTMFIYMHDPPLPNLVRIELLNELNPLGGDHMALKKWYKMTIAVLQTVDPTLSLYISNS